MKVYNTFVEKIAPSLCCAALLVAGTASADSYQAQGRVPSGGTVPNWAAWKITAADGSITETRSAGEPLRPEAEAALEGVPLWIRADLADLLSRLDMSDQILAASVISSVDDPRILDEVAWAVAYLSPEQIDDSGADLALVVQSAEWVYEMDPLLDYVTLVEHGVAGEDEDFWTTAEYVVRHDGVESTYTLPRDIYYAYVVHPVLQDEWLARMDPVTGSLTSSGTFWRPYVWQDDGERSAQRPAFLDHPVRIEQADLDLADFGAHVAGSVLTGPERSYSDVVRDAATGAPVMLEFVGTGGGCCSDDVPNPNGQVLVTTMALERAAAAGDDELLVALLGAGPGNLPLRDDMLASDDFSDTVDMRILVLRDRIPYGLATDPVEDALLASGPAPFDVVDSTGFAGLALTTTEAPWMPTRYVKIVVPSDQPIALYEALAARADDLAEYVRRGGTFEFHGDATEDWTDLAMPFGIDAAPFDGSSAVDAVEIGGFPRLLDVVAGAGYLWDGESQNLAGERALDPAEGALPRVAWWVSNNMPWNVEEMVSHRRDPALQRSVFPVRILYNHYGNCGELQDLYGAALRTVLIPASLTSSPLDDHVWNEFWEGDRWHPIQVSWSGSTNHIDRWDVGQDADVGGGKTLKAMITYRGDGRIHNVLGRYPTTVIDPEGHIEGDYSHHVTLRATVVDGDGAPVDGARLTIASHHLYDASGLYVATWGETGPDGTVDITVGEGEDYYVRVESPLGVIPGPGYVDEWVSAAEAEADAVFERTFSYAGSDNEGTPYGSMPSLDVTEVPPPAPPGPDVLSVALDVAAGRELLYGENVGFGYHWREPVADAAVDVLVVDEANLALLEAGEAFEAIRVGTGSDVAWDLELDPAGGDVWIVVANADRATNAKEVVVDIETDIVTLEPEPDGPVEPFPDADDPDASTDAATDDDAGDPGGGSGKGGSCGCVLVT